MLKLNTSHAPISFNGRPFDLSRFMFENRPKKHLTSSRNSRPTKKKLSKTGKFNESFSNSYQFNCESLSYIWSHFQNINKVSLAN